MKITNYKKIDKGCLISSFDISFESNGMTIHGMTEFKKDSQRWVNFPCKVYEKDGEKKRFYYISFTKEKKERLTKMCLEKIDNKEYEIAQEQQESFEDTQDVPF